MATVFLIHGTRGRPNNHWFPWLKTQLESLGHKVILPKFPTPNGQNLSNWLKVFEEYKKYLNKDSVIIGHSVGCAFALNLIQRLNVKIGACFLIAGFIEEIEDKSFTPLIHTFYEDGFDWHKINKNSTKYFVYGSDNDRYVSLKNVKNMADKLHIRVMVVKGAVHFTASSGYNEFPLLLHDIKKHLNSM